MPYITGKQDKGAYRLGILARSWIFLNPKNPLDQAFISIFMCVVYSKTQPAVLYEELFKRTPARKTLKGKRPKTLHEQKKPQSKDASDKWLV